MGQEFVKVADTKDIPVSQMKKVEVDGQKICILNIQDKYYAIGSVCTHEVGPLVDGTLYGHEFECPWHSSKFDARTGEVTSPPAIEPKPTYLIKLEDNSILNKKQDKSKFSSEIELTFLEKYKVNDTDAMSLKISKQNDKGEEEGTTSLDYKIGQFAFFDIGRVYNDPKGLSGILLFHLLQPRIL
ncbi:MAG: non-heme iron oxygenase ferredoxin subunit [Thermoproteota archaeon]|nr:non-heme iron oxygenase ferredoxin subunit [Thermoproteota archaeon]